MILLKLGNHYARTETKNNFNPPPPPPPPKWDNYKYPASCLCVNFLVSFMYQWYCLRDIKHAHTFFGFVFLVFMATYKIRYWCTWLKEHVYKVSHNHISENCRVIPRGRLSPSIKIGTRLLDCWHLVTCLIHLYISNFI